MYKKQWVVLFVTFIKLFINKTIDSGAAPIINTRNGFTRPLHSQQILSWVGYLLMFFIYFLVIFPSLTKMERIWVTIPFILLWIGFNTVFIIATLEKHTSAVLPEDTTENAIRCQWCRRKVQIGTKHCKSCDLCRIDFDHHCFFLNNCVTGENYAYFFSGIIMLYLCSFLCTCASIYVIMGISLDNNSMIILAEEFYGGKVPKALWYTLLGIFLFILLGIELFILYLLGLHTILIQKNISTFDVIQYWRVQAATKAAQQRTFTVIDSSHADNYRRLQIQIQREKEERARLEEEKKKNIQKEANEKSVIYETLLPEEGPPPAVQEKANPDKEEEKEAPKEEDSDSLSSVSE